MKTPISPNLSFTIQIFREGRTYVAHNPELNVSSCGDTLDDAKSNLKDALVGFLKSAQKLGTLDEILKEAGYVRKNKEWVEPRLVLSGRLSLVS